ncbi:MAG: cytochrome c oxidase assembly protein [Gammaproteobacteria bacterium]|nr:cytochrome c oxidase assembly protein [Gammaproteobacteria bacterium]
MNSYHFKNKYFPVIPGLVIIWITTLCKIAHAHGTIAKDQNLWTAWVYTPSITVPIVLTLLVYCLGLIRRRQQHKPINHIRTTLFFLGLFFFYFALQSPIEPLSDHYFYLHQIEHLMLRMFGPWLIILSMPMNTLIQGLPNWIRRGIVKPLIKNRIVHLMYRILTQPYFATFLFIASLYIWQIPDLHNQALNDQFLHDCMHVSMIVTAFFFWWVISDPRRTAARCTYGIRLFLLWAVTTFNSILGAIITMTRSEIYTGYNQDITAILMTAMEDQQHGGVILWVPGGMMGLLGTAVVFYLWVRDSKRQQRLLMKYSKQLKPDTTAA